MVTSKAAPTRSRKAVTPGVVGVAAPVHADRRPRALSPGRRSRARLDPAAQCRASTSGWCRQPAAASTVIALADRSDSQKVAWSASSTCDRVLQQDRRAAAGSSATRQILAWPCDTRHPARSSDSAANSTRRRPAPAARPAPPARGSGRRGAQRQLGVDAGQPGDVDTPRTAGRPARAPRARPARARPAAARPRRAPRAAPAARPGQIAPGAVPGMPVETRPQTRGAAPCARAAAPAAPTGTSWKMPLAALLVALDLLPVAAHLAGRVGDRRRRTRADGGGSAWP